MFINSLFIFCVCFQDKNQFFMSNSSSFLQSSKRSRDVSYGAGYVRMLYGNDVVSYSFFLKQICKFDACDYFQAKWSILPYNNSANSVDSMDIDQCDWTIANSKKTFISFKYNNKQKPDQFNTKYKRYKISWSNDHFGFLVVIWPCTNCSIAFW